MQDQFAVRIRNGPRDLQQQSHALGDRQWRPARGAAAVAIDRHPHDILEREIGLTTGRQAGVVEAGDVGMLEPGEDVPLALQAFRQLRSRPGAMR
jgi:hypothetical protein